MAEMSKFERAVRDAESEAYRRWGRLWHPAWWTTDGEQHQRSLAVFRESLSDLVDCDGNFMLFAGVNYRSTAVLPFEPRRLAFERRLRSSIWRAITDVKLGPGDLSQTSATIILAAQTLWNGRRPLYEVQGVFDRDFTYHSRLSPRLKTDRHKQFLATLDWHLRVTGIEYRVPQIHNLLVSLGGFPVDKSPDPDSWIHQLLRRRGVIEPANDGALMSLLLAYHTMHQASDVPCSSVCRTLDEVLSVPLVVSYYEASGRSGKRRLNRFLSFGCDPGNIGGGSEYAPATKAVHGSDA